MSTVDFQRARRPEQKQMRRQAILAAAAELLEIGPGEVTFNKIAAHIGLAKSNLYRYFDSREDVLLQLILEDEEAWIGKLESVLAPLEGSDDPRVVGSAIAKSLAETPRLCQLTSILTTVLEENVSRGAVARFKQRVGELAVEISALVSAALPSLDPDKLAELQRAVHALVAGLWPLAHPAPVVADLLAEPEFAQFRCDFEPELRSMITALLVGYQSREP